MKIILDAMGGDNAPLEIVKGALAGQKRGRDGYPGRLEAVRPA